MKRSFYEMDNQPPQATGGPLGGGGLGVAVEADAFMNVRPRGSGSTTYLTPAETGRKMPVQQNSMIVSGRGMGMGADVPSINFGGMLKDTLANIMNDLPKIGSTLATSWISKELTDQLELNAVEKKTNADGSKTVVVNQKTATGTQPVSVTIPAVAKGMPNWVLPVGIGAAALVGVVGLMAFKKRR